MSQRFQFHTQLFLKALSVSVADSKFILFRNKSGAFCLHPHQSRGTELETDRRLQLQLNPFAERKPTHNNYSTSINITIQGFPVTSPGR